MKFIHTADLQIGARFTQFGDKADLLRSARLSTFKRILEVAAEKKAEAVLVSGDTFESNQISDDLVEKTYELLKAHPDVPVVLLPGNHDPLDGPGCIWRRKPFSEPPAHVTVCESQDIFEIGQASFLPVPITQKISTKDPSLPMVDMAESVSKDNIKIGITHGALAIESKHQPNDHPIALDAASRAGLDYLAIGHWHKPQEYDKNRLVMPGTPEPDDFDQGSGTVSFVEISSPGAEPSITHLDCATYSWQKVSVNLLDQDATSEVIANSLSNCDSQPDFTVLRMELEGPLPAEKRDVLFSSITELTEEYVAVLIKDDTTTILSESLWNACLQEHPLLAQVFADVQQARSYSTGDQPALDCTGQEKLTINEFQNICENMHIDLNKLDKTTFESMMSLLTAEVGKIQSGGGSE